jgi:hypothetical protein
MTRTLAGLFLAALLGTLTIVGLALSVLGWVVLGPYLAVVAAGLALLVRRARSLARQAKHRDGRTCTCCTSTVFDPVEVR